jgi:hypothetical protein
MVIRMVILLFLMSPLKGPRFVLAPELSGGHARPGSIL